MKRVAFWIIIVSILSKILGFGREITLSYFFGATFITDAYLISLTIPGTIFTFVGTGIATIFIPMYSNILNKKGKEAADNFTSNVISMIICLSLFICFFVLIFTVPLVKLFASGFDDQTLTLAVHFTRISTLSIIFSGVIYVLTSYLNIKNKLITPLLAGIPFNLIIIFSIALSSKYDISILSIGFVTATAFQLLILIPLSYNTGYKYKAVLNLKDENIMKTGSLLLPVMLGTSIDQINKLVNRTIASQILVGGIAALNYSNRLIFFVQGIFVTSIVSVMYPAISRMVAANDIRGLKKTLADTLNTVNILLIPIIVFTMLFAKPIVIIIFGRGAFGDEAIQMTSSLLFYYSIGLLGVGLNEVISKVFYSMSDTKTPMINAAISMILNIALNLILSKFMGINGLALATSISAILCTILLFVNLRKKIGSFGLKSLFFTFMKIVISSLLMGTLAWFFFNYMDGRLTILLNLIITMILSGIIYLFAIYLLKVKEVTIIMQEMKFKIRKKK